MMVHILMGLEDNSAVIIGVYTDKPKAVKRMLSLELRGMKHNTAVTKLFRYGGTNKDLPKPPKHHYDDFRVDTKKLIL